jgi:hypothetical protein
MAIGDSSAGLLFRIKADGSQAEAELKKVTGVVDVAGTSFAGLAGPAALAGTAIAAVGAAAVALGVSFFNLTKSASEFGSALFDAAAKTGLSAAAISTLKFTADSAGSSLEKISGSVAKFNTLLGQAENGTKKAIAVLEQYGITAKTADEAFAQAVKRISEMDSAQQKAAASAALFKDRTGELLPVIDQMGGDFDEAIKQAQKLGITLTEEDLKAADDFGDTLGLLGTQAKVMASAFALTVAPQITGAMRSISQSLADNREEISDWAMVLNDLIDGTKNAIPELRDLASSFLSLPGPIQLATAGLADYSTALNIATFGIHSYILAQRQMYNEQFAFRKEAANRLRGDFTVDFDPGARRGTGSVEAGVNLGTSGTGGGTGGGRGGGRAARTPRGESPEAIARREAAAQLRIENEAIADLKRLYQNRTESFEAEAKKRYAIAVEYAGKDGRTEEDNARFKEFLAEQVLEYQIAELQKYINAVTKKGRADVDATQKLSILETNLETLRSENHSKEMKRSDAAIEQDKKEYDERKKHFSDYIQHKIEQDEKYDAEQQRQYEEQTERDRKTLEGSDATRQGTVLGGIADSMGLSLPSVFGDQGVIQDQADFMKAIYADVAQSAGGAIGQMTQGLASMAAAWLATGKFSAKAALQMASSVALSLAMQAGVAAIMELARGWAESAAAAASAAIFDFHGAALHSAAAGMHFASAGIFGTVAGVSAGAGVALGLGARAASSNSFNSETQRATGGTSSASGSGGSIYSSAGDDSTVINFGRNRPMNARQDVHVFLHSNDAHIIDVVKTDVANNGQLRVVIQDNASI